MHDLDDTLRLPASVPEPPRPVLPLAAALVPVAGAAVLWWLTASPTVWWMAALGPLMAAASFLDGLRGSRRTRRRARRAAAATLVRLTGAIEERHEAERRRAWRRTPDVAGYVTDPDEIWRVVPGRDELLVVGRGEVTSALRIEGETTTREARALRGRAATLADAPVVVPVAAGVAVVGPALAAAAVARALLLQLCLAQPPGRLRLAGDGAHGPALPHAEATAGIVVSVGTGDRPVPADVDVPIVRVAPGAPPPPRCAAVLTLDDAGGVDGARLDHGGVSRRVRVEAVSREQAARIAAMLAARATTLGHRVDGAAWVDELPVADRGAASSLGAVVGTTAGDPVVLDLVDDGPHAVVIGVTGSGKSELLTTWIVGMCRGRTPQEVSFLLVDFKGGRTFDALAMLPHVTGVLTDLDEARTVRAVDSLRAEVRHRERVLRTAGARDIDEARGLLPRLVIVVDEYAALVGAHPDLHELFADLAARGRALGLHLLLASQRASGAFRDGVLANAPLRIAFRVTDAADARTILGRDDAVHLSGAAAARGTALVRRAADSAPRTVRVARCGPAAIDALRVASADHAPARRPWLPPLPERISIAEARAVVAPDVGTDAAPTAAGREDSPAARRRRSDRRAPVPLVLGVVDEPDRQRRSALVLDAGTAGFAVIGGPGSGRSSLLRTVAAQAERCVRVEGDLEDAWDRVMALDGAPPGTVVLVDDADAIAARLPPDHAAAWVAALERAAREARSRGIVIALTASRATGPLGRVVDLLPGRAILALPTRADHVAAGGAPGEHLRDEPPGRGRWGSRLVQFALPDSGGGGEDASRPDGTASGDRAPVWRVGAGEPAGLVIADGPRADAVRAGLTASGVEVIPIAAVADAGSAQAVPRVVLGAPEDWLAQWRLLGTTRSRGELVVDAGCAAEYRAVTGRRELPPYVAPGAGRAWSVRADTPPRRVALPTGARR
ncbi:MULTISPECIES: FtsK/SpoIIIE domain-containing protein [unclassified Microbacterium]|uniref:FtsK/SpoIIIE domain-containing protein n=1 Tax=unclassified Microbacterium TaxID=2609290 RepID=UPI0030193118